MFVLLIPDGGIGSVFCQRSDDFRKISISRSVHRCLAVFVLRVNVRSDFHEEVDRLEHLCFCAGFFTNGTDSDASGGHNRHATFGVGNRWVSSKFQQEFHEWNVGRFRGEQKRCRSSLVKHGSPPAAFLKASVDVGSGADQLFDKLKTRQAS